MYHARRRPRTDERLLHGVRAPLTVLITTIITTMMVAADPEAA